MGGWSRGVGVRGVEVGGVELGSRALELGSEALESRGWGRRLGLGFEVGGRWGRGGWGQGVVVGLKLP